MRGRWLSLVLYIWTEGEITIIRRNKFVWFCKDVERVYIDKKVDDSQKKKEATTFKAKKLITKVDTKRLSVDNYRTNTSNIMNVLDRHQELARKN